MIDLYALYAFISVCLGLFWTVVWLAATLAWWPDGITWAPVAFFTATFMTFGFLTFSAGAHDGN